MDTKAAPQVTIHCEYMGKLDVVPHRCRTNMFTDRLLLTEQGDSMLMVLDQWEINGRSVYTA